MSAKARHEAHDDDEEHTSGSQGNEAERTDTPSVAEDAAIPVAANSGGALKEIISDDFDALEAIGGVRGILEAVAPTILFLAVFVLRDDLNLALVISVSVALALIAFRAISRIPIAPALGGLFAIVVSAFLAWRSGEASDFFVWGLITNAAYFVALGISVLAKWPLLGLLIGALRGDATGWRTDPSQKLTRSRYYRVTLLWVFLFATRLLVQVPLYLTNSTEALGVARLVMGVPFFALIAWFSWLLVKDLPPVPADSDEQTSSRKPNLEPKV